MSTSPAVKTLFIDGKPLSGMAGETILDVAEENNIEIPTLCHLEGLSSIGACRLCMVEIEGHDQLHPACITEIEEGMKITTHSERLLKYRRMIIELLFSERNHICSVCSSNGHCDMQDMAQKLGVDHIRFPYRNPRWSIDASHARFAVDHNLCILCERCVRVCEEIEGAHTWDIACQGIDTHIITDFDTGWGDSETCTGCGKCIHVCPTGALTEKNRSVSEAGRRRQFLPYLVMRREVQQ